MVIAASLALGIAVSLGGVFAYSMASVASLSDSKLHAARVQSMTVQPRELPAVQPNTIKVEV
ncbi:MAG: hypothetical protein AB4050_17965 [Synechococcus sp.]